MPKLLGLDTNDRFNLAMALIAWLWRRDSDPTIDDAAEHFGVSRKDLLRAVGDINNVAPNVGGREQGLAYIDMDALDEGILQIESADYLREVPKISGRQGSALLAGLGYLSSLPDFAGDPELAHLQSILTLNLNAGQSVIELVQEPVDPDVAVLREAMSLGKRIRCDYINQAGENRTRELDPLRIDPRPDNWYLQAWCVDSKMVKRFRLDRMKNSLVTDIDISDEARGALTENELLYVSKETDTDVVVEVAPEAYRLIAEAHKIEDVIRNADNQGVIRATIKVGYLPNIGHLIARYGGAAKVIEPKEAREYVAEFARRALGQTASVNEESVE